MRANRRRDKSSCAHEIELKDANGFHVAFIGIRDAREGVLNGVYSPSYAPYKMGTAVQRRELISVRLSSNRMPSYKAKPPITRGESAANAGLHGESRTIHLNEYGKALRVARIYKEENRFVPEEDHIELAKIKVALFPVEIDHKAVRTGPLPNMEEIAQFVSV